jgi:multiple sugar transport system substrate-binding protein
MKRIVATLMFSLVMGGFLFAAGAAETPVADKPVTIKVANYAILEGGYEPFWKSVKTGFEAKNPNITIEWVSAPYGEIVNQVVIDPASIY